jgi:aminopeptidase
VEKAKLTDVYIYIRSDANLKELSSIKSKKISIRSKARKPVKDVLLAKRWCLTQYPTPAYAQEAGMSLAEYENFLYSAVLIDWPKARKRMKSLQRVMNETDVVHILGEGTDLTFSIRGRKAILSDGTHNMPGGEVFTAPVDDSATGKIYFDLPAIRYGKEVRDVRLKLEQGEIVDYSASKGEDLLEAMIGTDEGSQRLGEFAIGTNYGIKKFTRNILFDEKIGGTIHLAIGRAYPECGGVNNSAIHWDFIKTMKPGQVLMDGRVVLQDGKLKV